MAGRRDHGVMDGQGRMPASAQRLIAVIVMSLSMRIRRTPWSAWRASAMVGLRRFSISIRSAVSGLDNVHSGFPVRAE